MPGRLENLSVFGVSQRQTTHRDRLDLIEMIGDPAGYRRGNLCINPDPHVASTG